MRTHSLVIPVYNEKPGLPALFDRVKALADRIETHPPNQSGGAGRLEIILVNDGSRDGSAEVLDSLAARDPRVNVIHLSRNFGHQIAITAGMEWAGGETVTVMDADLQDPPELIVDMLAQWSAGFEVIYAVRRKRAGETPFKLATAAIFYRIMKRLTQVDIPLDTGDFRLMDRKAVDAFLSLPERHRFIRGMVAWVGFRQIGVPYDRASRVAGETHYPFRKMLKFALDGVTSFSIIPLQMASYLGVASAGLGLLGIVWALYVKLFTTRAVLGWTSLIIVVLFLGSAQLLALGVMGEYLGRTYDESRRRPLYFVARTAGFREPRAARRSVVVGPTA